MSMTFSAKTKLSSEFEKYLLEEANISKKSLKFYRSDLKHFSCWLIFQLKSQGSLARSFSETVPFISPILGGNYKEFLILNNSPKRTINRRLSTLRHLAKFFQFSGSLDFNFMSNVENMTSTSNLQSAKPALHPAIRDFEAHLRHQKLSQNTIKNYLNDIKQFMAWLEKEGAI